MQAQILGIATSGATYAHKQRDIAEVMVERLGLRNRLADKLRSIYHNSAIEKRHTVIENYFGKECDHFFCKETYPRMRERNEIYKKKAPLLAAKVAKEVLEKTKVDPTTITHVISVSCTGVFAPGLEFSLIKELGLLPSIERIGLNMMGCFGAFRGLAVASSIALANPGSRILLLCTELCSLHFLPTLSWENLVSNALFGDGSAAAIVGTGSSHPCFKIVRTGAFAVPDSFEEMQWQAGDEALLMKLSPEVPACLKEAAPQFAARLLQDIPINSCDFPIHPGGKAILENIEGCLELTREQTQSSWNILAGYGNMSSATFLFVLDDLLKTKSTKSYAVGLGFGPGLSLEGILLAK